MHLSSENSTPLLDKPRSDMRSTGSQKPSNPHAVEILVVPRQSRFLSKLWGWPAMVICGQTILIVFAWSFFGVLQSRGFIALPRSSAAWAQDHSRSVTLISTLISTLLSAYSSFLFSFGVRRSIALQLRRPTSLATFVSALRISRRSPVLTPRRWTAPSFVIILLAGLQTSIFVIMQNTVALGSPALVSSSELDLSSPVLRQMPTTGTLHDCTNVSSTLAAFLAGQRASGYALARNTTGAPASFTLMDQTWNVSTAGILPATLSDVNASIWFLDITIIPASIKPDNSLPHGISSNYSMNQPGFSVDVTCELQSSTANVEPSLTVHNETPEWSTGGPIYNLTYIKMSADCPGPDNSTPLIFSSSGVYNITNAVCNLSPRITRVNVEYSHPKSVFGMISSSTTADNAILDPDGPAGLSAVITVYSMMFLSQGLSSHSMADDIRSLYAASEGDPFQAALRFMEEYIRGVAEYSGSVSPFTDPPTVPSDMTSQVFRACLSGHNGTFLDGSFGWMSLSGSSVLVLIPGTLVTLITILIVLVAVAQNQHAEDPPSHLFDPADTIHLLAAATAGGLDDVFRGGYAEDIEQAGQVNVVLGSIPGRGPALIPRSTW
ncbi:hypothetical protein FB451DRAFT_1416048 [Mycena latifolia]|nr:hypothetical protein FB451DRAFT_1416048 [Mycena latifolia]